MIPEINFDKLLNTVHLWAKKNLFIQDVIIHSAISLLLLAFCLFLSRLIAARIRKALEIVPSHRWYTPTLIRLRERTYLISGTLVFIVYAHISEAVGHPSQIPYTIASLMAAFLVISFATSMLGKGYLVNWIKYTVLIVVGLNIFGYWDQSITYIDKFFVDIGGSRISIYSVVKGVTIFVVLLWFAITFSLMIDKVINRSKELSPSLKVLSRKIIRFCLYGAAILIGLKSIGFDLTLFTVFSGALGVGIGFGLQKVVSNFISGIILLTDRSIKPGDVIVVEDTYGWVNSLGARYVSVITRDGKEHLIPNESLITQKVENWSFSNDQVRVRIPVGVAYNSDVRKAIELINEAASESDRVLEDPAPCCLLRGFGDNSVDLELRIWIKDPANGVGNIQSEVLLNIWDKFHENNIEIPYPQRDIHIKDTPTSLASSTLNILK